jgi:hypothetical protein
MRQQHFDFGKMEKEVPEMPFGAAVRCIVAIQESGILSLVLSCKRLREEGRVVERMVGALKARIMVNFAWVAGYGSGKVKWPPTMAEAKWLLHRVESPDDQGLTTLWRLAPDPFRSGSCRSLIMAGADANAADWLGTTVLMRAASGGAVAVVRALLGARAQVNTQGNDGWTALMYATANSAADNVDLLLQRKADVNAKNKRGETALQLAKTDVIRDRLIQAGALPTSAKKPAEGGLR